MGRIAIPGEMLRGNLFEDGALFYIRTVPEGILLVPAEGLCALCGGSEELVETREGLICRACIKDAAKKMSDYLK